jgi:2-amino-4-hydroxy-6-hydroxymethyldihydropteridine diphosphokinase
MRYQYYLSLGSNIAPAQNLPRAVDHLAAAGRLVAVSAAYETEPVGKPEQPPFLNAAVILANALPANDLKRYVITGIENTLGRQRDPQDKYAPRTIDIDIALWEDLEGQASRIIVSDPDILRFAHLAVPLAEIAPRLVHPSTGEPLAAIAARLAAGGQRVVPRPEVVLPLPEGGD